MDDHAAVNLAPSEQQRVGSAWTLHEIQREIERRTTIVVRQALVDADHNTHRARQLAEERIVADDDIQDLCFNAHLRGLIRERLIAEGWRVGEAPGDAWVEPEGDTT